MLGLLELFFLAVVVVVATTYCVEIGFILIVVTRVLVMIVFTSLVSSPCGSGPGGLCDGRSADVAMARIVRVTSN